jgi:hypothetical protein
MPTESQPASEPGWFKSPYSGGNTTECVEATFTSCGVLIRDSKRPQDPHVAFSAEAWSRFTATLWHITVT